METMQEKTGRQYAAEALLTGHYHYLLQALAVAMCKCLVWRLSDTGQPFTADDLLNFAKEQDKHHPLEKGAFYMVSREGAIGLAPGLEYMVKWMFMPMEKGAERDRLLQELGQLMKQQEAEEKADRQPQATPAPPQERRFCGHCGTPLWPGARFCTSCGTPVATALN